VKLDVWHFESAAGRRPSIEFLRSLRDEDHAFILADITALSEGNKTVSTTKIKGHRKLCEIKTKGFRTFYTRVEDVLVILHVCKKQDQIQGIKVAAQRIKEMEATW
jgi:hypothetical protein